jgi:cellulose synthase/poly-beta-1,6-N-acetylglucosamine synthase-like glycosyltransferase
VSKTIGVTIPAYRPDISQINQYIKSIRDLDFIDTIHIELDKPSVVDVSSIVGFDSMNTVEERRGKGKAITAGFDFLSTDVFVFADADGAIPANSLKSYSSS